jgi:hypothetical protein
MHPPPNAPPQHTRAERSWSSIFDARMTSQRRGPRESHHQTCQSPGINIVTSASTTLPMEAVRSMRLDKSSPLMQRIYPFTTTPQRGHPCAWAAGADLSLVTVSPITRTTPPYLDRSKFTAPLRLVRQHGAIVMHTAKARLKTATIQPRGCRLTIHLRRVAISF